MYARILYLEQKQDEEIETAVDFGGTAAEKSAGELNINDGTNPAVVSGQWVSIDVPITIGPWTNNITRTDVAQFVISSNFVSNSGNSVPIHSSQNVKYNP